MSTPYTGTERRKASQIELLTKRVLQLELASSQQQEVLELAVGHLKTEQRKLDKEMLTLKDICRGCIGYQDDYK